MNLTVVQERGTRQSDRTIIKGSTPDETACVPPVLPVVSFGRNTKGAKACLDAQGTDIRIQVIVRPCWNDVINGPVLIEETGINVNRAGLDRRAYVNPWDLGVVLGCGPGTEAPAVRID